MLKRFILFDIDGTLVDSNDAHVDAWQQAFSSQGYQFTRRQIHHQVGKGGDNLVPSLMPNVAPDVQQRLERAHGEIYKKHFLPSVEPFPGAREALRNFARRGHSLLLASSASRKEVDHYVDLLDADGLLSGTTSKDDVASSKPCPDIFVAALSRAGSSPEGAIVVGDTPYDIIAARRASIDAIAVLSGRFPEEELRSCNPLAVYGNVAELDAQYASSPFCAGRLMENTTEAP